LAPAVQENEFAILRSITSTITPERYHEGLFSIPAAAAMNAPYGTRRSYNGGPVNNFHSGADFASAPNTPIFAAGNGVVVLADTLNIRGNTIVIDHGWGIYTLYAHQTSFNVSVGDRVITNQTIGFAGSTGRVTGPHLHWEVWVNGVPVNPITWTQRTFP
ncbi:MAG: M23 family metallopeptidase, partial [Anaerolineae bacterium]|nr:M23 family metallopeptidase [Anaerolineae bacterium]